MRASVKVGQPVLDPGCLRQLGPIFGGFFVHGAQCTASACYKWIHRELVLHVKGSILYPHFSPHSETILNFVCELFAGNCVFSAPNK